MLSKPAGGVWLCLYLCLALVARAADAPGRASADLAPPAADVVRSRVMEWAALQGTPEKAVLEELGAMLRFGDEPLSAAELFDRTIMAFALVDPTTRTLVQACRLDASAPVPPEWKPASEATPFYLANVGLFYGRYLCQCAMYEEGLDVLDSVAAADVVDPASLLFFRAVCQHQLLKKTEGLKTLEQLLKHTEGVPSRYSSLATLMQYDLEGLQDKTLDGISRKMLDVERRLKLGRAGQKVQKQEDEIVANLDELIKKIEQQQGGGGGGGQDGGNNNQSNSPAQDSHVKGATAPGNVDPKKFKNEGGWGALPDKARARAREQIARDFPAHYRQAVEEYTRKLATRAAAKK